MFDDADAYRVNLSSFARTSSRQHNDVMYNAIVFSIGDAEEFFHLIENQLGE